MFLLMIGINNVYKLRHLLHIKTCLWTKCICYCKWP